MEIVIRTEFEPAILLNFNVDDVIHETTIWQDQVQNRLHGVWFERQHHKVEFGTRV